MNYDKQYYNLDSAVAYTGARNLLHVNKKNKALNTAEKKKIYAWLRAQDAYTLHKPVKRRFPRLYYNIKNLDDVWEIDLAVLTSLEKFNDGFNYILVVIDALSKYVWTENLKVKTATAVADAFQKILVRASGRVCVCLQSDKGREFTGAAFQNVLKKHDIKFRVARNPDIKCSIVERVIRTLKERMYRYFSYKNTKRYVDVIQKIVHGYNNTVHSGTKMKPSEVNFFNAMEARKNLIKRSLSQTVNKNKTAERAYALAVKYEPGEYVRISRTKNTFEPGYEKNYSEEVFVIERVSHRQGLRTYILTDLNGEEIDGFFYPQELSLVAKKRMETDQEFKIDRIVTSKGRGSNRQHLVKWVGYPEKFNSWVKASDIKAI